MSKENKFEVSKFEQLETSNGEILQGGFSTSGTGTGIPSWLLILLLGDILVNGYCPEVNNCSGGNCAQGCSGGS